MEKVNYPRDMTLSELIDRQVYLKDCYIRELETTIERICVGSGAANRILSEAYQAAHDRARKDREEASK